MRMTGSPLESMQWSLCLFKSLYLVSEQRSKIARHMSVELKMLANTYVYCCVGGLEGLMLNR